LEFFEGGISFALRHIPIEDSNFKSRFLYRDADSFGISFGLSKDGNFIFAMCFDDSDEVENLVIVGNTHESMIDFVHGYRFTDLDEFVGRNMLFDDYFDFVTDGRAEGRCLFYIFHMCSNSLDIADKSHVQHSIDFVENEILNGAEVDDFLIDEIQQSTWSRNDNAWSSEQSFFLDERTRSSINAGRVDSIIFGKFDNFFTDLIDQFPGRSHDKRLESGFVGVDFLQ